MPVCQPSGYIYIYIFAQKYFTDGVRDKNFLDEGSRALGERLAYSRSVIRICPNLLTWCLAKHMLVTSKKLHGDTVTG